MSLPHLPTDNLYKFLALFGMLVFLASGVFYWVENENLSIKKLELLTKSLRPLPEKWHGLKDQELRLRKRYLDLISNPENKEIFIKKNIFIFPLKQ